MKRLLSILLLLTAGCASIDRTDPYADTLCQLTVTVAYPEEYAEYRREGVTVSVEIDGGNSYKAVTDAEGRISLRISNGIYRIQVNDKIDGFIFNGTADKVKLVNRDIAMNLPLSRSTAGEIVIKEIYCGGCMRTPQEGQYQYDKYVILHNNTSEVQYLDSLCFGVLDPYNSQATNVWVKQNEQTGATEFPDFVPIVQALWQFGGDGTTFPLQPGEDAVICCCGAIDHAAQYPLSVNLNKPGYFVLYNNTYFPNTLYHPAPGDRIETDHYLNVVIKTGIANAYPLSIFSPAPVIFRIQGMTAQEYVRQEGNVIQKPGSNSDNVIKIPAQWVIDGVEVFYGGSSNNKKRLSQEIDAGYVTQSEIYLGRTLHRHVDEEASKEAGYEVLVDTNNSSADFYERSQQSLHE